MEKKMTVRDIIVDTLNKQWGKGVEKYGISIEDVPPENYDWNIMALEEMADGITYVSKENRYLMSKIQLLEAQIDQYAKAHYQLRGEHEARERSSQEAIRYLTEELKRAEETINRYRKAYTNG